MKLFNSDIEDLIREILIKQETEINKYIEKYMTVDEVNRHADNIYNLIARAEPTIAFLKMKLLNETKTKHRNLHKYYPSIYIFYFYQFFFFYKYDNNLSSIIYFQDIVILRLLML